ncbi:MAG TPA: acetate--CoA ligase family protein [Actinomycetes bacterium]|nr:acetate--CoA ligase family protein [Actinomycetes bacterium]
MNLDRLLAPRSVAVVGATPRPGSYGNQAVENLVEAKFDGPVYGVHPRETEVLGVPCFPTLSDLPEVPDAIVIATPAATVPDLIDEAGRLGVGGAVVIAAGFAEVEHGRELQQQLRDNALRHNLPVCGPNGNGLVSVVRRAPLWGDGYNLAPAGGVALVSQSGNVAVNAIGSTRALHLHTVISCGNQAVLETSDYLVALAQQDGVRSVALYLEAEGDGAKLAEGLALCAEREIGVVVLKSGRSALGATAAAAHTGAVAGDAKVLRALVEDAGGAWVDDPHELLETAKAMAHGRRKVADGIAVITCSGGDAAISADEADRLGIPMPPLAESTKEALRPIVPPAATVGNPLDYTAQIWGDVPVISSIVRTTASDPSLGQVLVYYDHPQKMGAAATESWSITLDAILLGAQGADAPVMVASTMSDLLPEDKVDKCLSQGVPAVWGLTTGIKVADAMRRPFGDPQRLRQISAISGARTPGPWLAEHEAKELLAKGGVSVPRGGVATTLEEVDAVVGSLDGPLALKLSSASLQHKSDIGALELGVVGVEAAHAAFQRLRAIDGHAHSPVLIEQMEQPGVELLIAARRDSVVPALVVGLGGVWVEAVGDAAIIPLPADAARVERALRRLRGASLLTGGRGRPAVDIAAVADLAVRVGQLLIDEDLMLIELNPVFARPIGTAHGATAVDAVIRRTAQ